MTKHCPGDMCPAAKRLYQHVWYRKNKDQQIAYNVERNRRPDVAAKLQAYRDRPENKQKALEYNRKRAAAKPELMREYETRKCPIRKRINKNVRKRRVRVCQPPWLTPAQKLQIKAVYREAAFLTALTGDKWDVDHIVPVAGGTVCGLHVPWNLRVATSNENNKRPRLWDPERDADLGRMGWA